MPPSYKVIHRELKSFAHRKAGKVTHAVLDTCYLFSTIPETYCNDATDSSNAADHLDTTLLANDTDLPYWVAGTVVMLAWSLVGYLTKKPADSENDAPQSMSYQTQLFFFRSWYYFRDFLGGLKNGRKAVVNLSFILQQFVGANWYAVANPLGIIVGIVLALMMVWYRRMEANRDAMISNNQDALDEQDIQDQSSLTRFTGLLVQFIIGTADGMYLYGCLFLLIGVGVAAFPPNVLIAAAVAITIYTLFSVMARMHEEAIKQHNLQNSIDNARARISGTNNELVPPAATGVMAALWMVGRAILSGAKNGKAAVDYVAHLIKQAVVYTVCLFVGIVVAALYAAYLGVVETAKYLRAPALISAPAPVSTLPDSTPALLAELPHQEPAAAQEDTTHSQVAQEKTNKVLSRPRASSQAASLVSYSFLHQRRQSAPSSVTITVSAPKRSPSPALIFT